MASFPPVEASVRTIRLLQALNRQPISSLDALHRQTGIPKPSLVRLLQTLVHLGLVRRAPQHGAYFLTSSVRSLASGYHHTPHAIEAAAPVLDDLTDRIKWPSALAMLEGDAAVVRYSTIPRSPLSLLHSTLGQHLSLVGRALGRACLAFCDPVARDALIGALQINPNTEEDLLAGDPDTLRLALETIRDQGYALRDPAIRPVSNTLAVPVFENGQVIASIGITFFSSTLSSQQAVQRYLADLQQASDTITATLAELAPETDGPAQKGKVRE